MMWENSLKKKKSQQKKEEEDQEIKEKVELPESEQ